MNKRSFDNTGLMEANETLFQSYSHNINFHRPCVTPDITKIIEKIENPFPLYSINSSVLTGRTMLTRRMNI